MGLSVVSTANINSLEAVMVKENLIRFWSRRRVQMAGWKGKMA
jgi:hypothetical protein